MSTNYEELYGRSRDALGAPTKEFLDFFESLEMPNASVLDVGCGQGRDALHVARRDHVVTAVDVSATGIRHLLDDAATEGLNIEAVVADIREFVPDKSYDVVLIDRTLHMLPAKERIRVLHTLLAHTAKGAFVLIADEKSNIPAFEAVFDASDATWSPVLKRRGYLFMQRNN